MKEERSNKTKSTIMEYAKKHKYAFLVFAIIIALVLSLLFIPPLFKNDSLVSTSDLRNYIKEYLSQYLTIVNENQPFDGISSNLTFFWHTPNEIEGVVSSSHGAVVFFNYSEGITQSITVKEFSKPIEYYIYPQMSANISGLPSVRMVKGVYVLDSQVSIPYGLLYAEPEAILRYIGQGHVFNISKNSAVLIFGTLIEENRMILKGSNNKEDWSTLQARFDALDQFVWDCRGFNATKIEIIKEKYEMTFMLERISSRMETGRYRDDPNLFTQDFEKLKESGATDATLSEILLQFYENQKTPPSWLESVWNFFIQTIVGQLLIVTIFGGVIATLIGKRLTSKKRKRGSKASL
jgi:hypothetical protein